MLEAEDHNDAVLEDFHDTYLNLTLKTTFLLKWVGKDCPASKFVFKIFPSQIVNPVSNEALSIVFFCNTKLCSKQKLV